MIAQIHDRLEDLVTNSAQLIFVGSDTVAQQQQNLENFLTQQDENVEIAFIQVGVDDTSDSLRRSICAQLMHVNSSGFERPLNELLHELNHIPDPVLICLTHAQHLSEAMLNELWKLVLQSRFGANQLHLNIILFADTQWAQAAQLALANQQDEPPIILTNDAFTYEYQGSELDQMIAQKREAFAQRIAQRNAPLPEQALKRHFIHSTFFLASMVSLLFILAVMLVALQYPQGKAFFANLFNSLPNNTTILSTPESSDSPLAVFDKQAAPLILPERATELTKTVDQTNLTNAKAAVAPHAVIGTAVETYTSTAELPYMTWQQALAHNQNKEKTTAVKDTTFVMQLPSSASEESTTAAQESSAVSVSNVTAVASDDTLTTNQRDKVVDTAPEPVIFSDNRNDFLAKVPNSYFVIQLSGMANPTVAQEFINKFDLQNEAWYYTTQRFGGDWSVVLLNNHFSTRQDALLRINSFTPEIKAMSPFVKSAQAVIIEINRVDDNS